MDPPASRRVPLRSGRPRSDSTAVSTTRSGRRPSLSLISRRRNRRRALHRPIRWRSAFSTTLPDHRRRIRVYSEQPRLQPAVFPQQCRPPLGMAARQHFLRRLAAEPIELRCERRSRRHRRSLRIVFRRRRQHRRHQDDVLDVTLRLQISEFR